MREFIFTVRGIGLEQGFICIDCVKSLIKYVSEEPAVDSVTFSSVRKEFTVLSSAESAHRMKFVIAKAVKKAGESLNKCFIPDNIRSV